MYTKDEIVSHMVALNIVMQIGDKFLITEKYKNIDAPKLSAPVEPVVPSKQSIDRDALLDGSTNGSDWPVEILETTGRARASAFIRLCEIPPSVGNEYRLTGMNAEATNILGNIIESDEISPNDMIECVKLYYNTYERPKALKNLLIDGDVFDMYDEFMGKEYNPDKKTSRWS